MKLKSSHDCVNINHTLTNLAEAVSQHKSLYKLSKNMMATTANADKIFEFLTCVNLANNFLYFVFLPGQWR